ncbi:MAG TPA: glycoside hydrolase family 6 protein [Micromonosporaceae bacterium]|nr:glycoside hydrolase family 6 protein [Micromonosporaceae bacterium]
MRFSLPSGAQHTRLRRGIAAGAALVVGSGLFVFAASQAHAATGCSVAYSANSWPGGFTANLNVTNTGDPISDWTLEIDFTAGQRVTQAWQSDLASQSGGTVTLRKTSWQGTLGTGASVTPGFNGSWSGSNPNPTTFRLNGVTCNGGTTVTTPPGNGSTPPVTVTTPPAESTTPPPVETTGPPVQGGGVHVANPYAGARGYVNPEWAAKVRTVAGGERIANQPTAVWMDRTAAIAGSANSSSNGSMGLRDHLDEALEQGAGYIQVVIYNLPGRDCAALASNGELPGTLAGLETYKTQYINAIAAIQRDVKYRNLRIINIIEIDSLPNLITNLNDPECAEMDRLGIYEQGVSYALGTLTSPYNNIYKYIDAAHHGWIGWDTNFGPAAQLFAEVARAASGGIGTVDGFITNTANYSALVEPFLNNPPNGQRVQMSDWVDWNPYVDELTFAQAFRTRLISLGFSSDIGMLIDTSRNGWGGPDRPTAASTSTDLNTFVEESRIDRRIHAGNWCNQAGAGLGERPRANPAPGIDAYVWVKPPGESDGSATLIQNNEGKGFDRMCDPTFVQGTERNGFSPTGALAGAPISGAFFPAQLAELMRNAYPVL